MIDGFIAFVYIKCAMKLHSNKTNSEDTPQKAKRGRKPTIFGRRYSFYLPDSLRAETLKVLGRVNKVSGISPINFSDVIRDGVRMKIESLKATYEVKSKRPAKGK